MKQTRASGGSCITVMEFVSPVRFMAGAAIAVSLLPALAPAQTSPPAAMPPPVPAAGKTLDASAKKTVLDAMQKDHHHDGLRPQRGLLKMG